MTEFVEMAAEAEEMEVAHDEAELGAARIGSSGAPSTDAHKSAFDIITLLRRNDTRGEHIHAWRELLRAT